jgi:hypothetical protein
MRVIPKAVLCSIAAMGSAGAAGATATQVLLTVVGGKAVYRSDTAL